MGAMKRETKYRRLAMHCGTPMVSTLMFSGAEFYCVMCGGTEGIFGGDSVESTPELEQELDENEAKFKEVAGDCIPAGCYFHKCEKCQPPGAEEHFLHASKEDLEKSDAAYKLLHGGMLKEESHATH